MRTTGDACPGVLRLHEAADGALARVRVPGGCLTRAALLVLADAADELGDGAVDLTARGNVQLRGLPAGAGPRLEQLLVDAGLLPSATHERARNLVASPLSGLDGVGLVDVSPLVAEVDEMLCAAPELADLSGRFLLGLDDGRGDMVGLEPDLALVGVSGSLLALLTAGLDTGIRVRPRRAATALVGAAREFVRVQDQQGEGAWRVRELRGGAEGFARGVRMRLGGVTEDAPRLSLSAQRGGGPDRGPVGVVRDAGGRASLAAVVPLGRLSAAQARAVADECGDSVRLTPWRGVILPKVGPDPRAPSERLTRAGLVLDPASPWVGVSACAGEGACASSLADVRADAVAASAGRIDCGSAARVHWSGCERRCGHPAGEALEVVAGSDGYRLAADGRSLALGLSRLEAIAAVQDRRASGLAPASEEPG